MGAFKLGKMTFGSLFKKPETVMYPVETKPQPAGLKGHIEIDVDECILCGMCERSCTTSCISVDKQKGVWEIKRMQCIQCGYCVTICPKKCLSMDPNYTPPETSPHLSIYMVGSETGSGKKPTLEADIKAESTPPAQIETPAAGKVDDRQLETLLTLMDPAKAEKVRSTLS